MNLKIARYRVARVILKLLTGHVFYVNTAMKHKDSAGKRYVTVIAPYGEKTLRERK